MCAVCGSRYGILGAANLNDGFSESGPVVLFTKDLSISMVISSARYRRTLV